MFIQDIYKLDESLETIYIEKYGQWDASKGITIFERNIFILEKYKVFNPVFH